MFFPLVSCNCFMVFVDFCRCFVYVLWVLHIFRANQESEKKVNVYFRGLAGLGRNGEFKKERLIAKN